MIDDSDSVLKLRSNELTWREVDGEIIALDLTSSLYFTTNRTGALLWERLVEGCSLSELAATLTERFELDEAEARSNVASFIALLDAHSLLERH